RETLTTDRNRFQDDGLAMVHREREVAGADLAARTPFVLAILMLEWSSEGEPCGQRKPGSRFGVFAHDHDVDTLLRPVLEKRLEVKALRLPRLRNADECDRRHVCAGILVRLASNDRVLELPGELPGRSAD